MSGRQAIGYGLATLTTVGMSAIVSVSARAAGVPSEAAAAFLPVFVVLVLVAAGVGFALGGILKLGSTVVALIALTLSATALVWLTYDAARALDAAAILFVLLVMLSPFIGLGWWLGRKDAERRRARRLAYENGK
jgi:hypothetical protein